MSSKLFHILTTLFATKIVIYGYYFWSEDLRFINYCIVAITVIILPYLLGNFCLRTITKNHNRYWKVPREIRFWSTWIIGLVLLNIPYILNTKLKQNDFFIVIIYLWLWVLIYLLSIRAKKSKNKKLSFTWRRASKHKSKKHRNIYQYLSQQCYKYLSIKSLKKTLQIFQSPKFWLTFLGFGITLFYFGWWRARLGFITNSFDIFQNYQVGNIYRSQHKFAIFADGLSPMFTFVTYTNVLIPIYAFIGHLFPVEKILEAFVFIELIIPSVAYFSRKKILEKLFEIPPCLSPILVAISFLLTSNGGIYALGELLNQQIIVILSIPVIYLHVKRMWLWLLLLIPISFLFHFLGTVMMIGWIIFHVAFEIARIFLPKLLDSKLLRILALGSSLVVVGLSSIVETKKFIISLLGEEAAKSVHFENIIWHSQLYYFEYVADSFGIFTFVTIVVGAIFCLIFIKSKNMWIVAYAVALLTVLFSLMPYAPRFISMAAIPFVVTIYYFSTIIFKQYLQIIFLLFLCFSTLGMQFFIKDKGTLGDYWNYALIEQWELESAKTYQQTTRFPKIVSKENINNVKIITDYIGKHGYEVAFEKFNDDGFYNKNLNFRLKNYKHLRNEKEDACQTHNTPYLLYIMGHRTALWIRLPEVLAAKEGASIWHLEGIDKEILHTIENFVPKVEKGKIQETLYIGNTKFILVKCEDEVVLDEPTRTKNLKALSLDPSSH